MANFERYSAVHKEVMKRLETGEITTEQAKEVIDMSFEKYITEGWVYPVLSGVDLTLNLTAANLEIFKHLLKILAVCGITTAAGVGAGIVTCILLIIAKNKNKPIILTDKSLTIYRDMIELYAKDHKLINPKDVKISSFSANIFNKLDDDNKAIVKTQLLASSKNSKKININDSNDEPRSDESIIEELIQKEKKYTHCMIYKNKIIAFYNDGNMELLNNSPYITLSTKSNDKSHDNYYLPMILSYHSGQVTKTNDLTGLTKILNYLKSEYPDEYSSTKEALKKTKLVKD